VIHVYNGITPNGDNDNSNWYIDGIQGYPENKVVIFNRWGSKVWSASGYNNKDVVWRGTDQQGNFLPDGTYYYLIELYDEQGATIFSESKWVEITH
jgi:gliding motility-associated-like protein